MTQHLKASTQIEQAIRLGGFMVCSTKKPALPLSSCITVREKVGEPHRRSEIKVSALMRASTLLAYITIWSYRQVVPDSGISLAMRDGLPWSI